MESLLIEPRTLKGVQECLETNQFWMKWRNGRIQKLSLTYLSKFLYKGNQLALSRNEHRQRTAFALLTESKKNNDSVTHFRKISLKDLDCGKKKTEKDLSKDNETAPAPSLLAPSSKEFQQRLSGTWPGIRHSQWRTTKQHQNLK